MNRGWVLLAVFPLVVSGCIVEPGRQIAPHDRPASLILDFTLKDTSDGHVSREANPGPDCATAKWSPSSIGVAEDVMEIVGLARPVLVVIPVLEGGWTTSGEAAYAMATPESVTTGIPNEDKIVGQIEWKGNKTHGYATIDNERIPLPYYWKVVDETDEWQVDAVIRMGPAMIHTYENFPCE